jgi:hypothetical protein
MAGWKSPCPPASGCSSRSSRVNPDARRLHHTLKAESLAGPLPDSQLSSNVARLDANQTFAGTIAFTGRVGIGTTNPGAALDVQGVVQAGSFNGNGAGLSNIAATTLSARLAQRLWRVAIPFVAVTNAGNAPDVTGAAPWFPTSGSASMRSTTNSTPLSSMRWPPTIPTRSTAAT